MWKLICKSVRGSVQFINLRLEGLDPGQLWWLQKKSGRDFYLNIHNYLVSAGNPFWRRMHLLADAGVTEDVVWL